jgi:Flp pilus assembly protein TadD
VLLFQCDAMEGRTESALQELEGALRADPSSPRAHRLRGEAYLSLHRVADARRELAQAIAIDPTCPAAYAQLAVLELSEGWVVKGKNLARKALALAPDAPEAKAALAMVEAALDHGEEADKLALQALNDPSCDPASRLQALTVRMLVAAMQGQWDKADAFLREGRMLAPFNPAMLVFAASVCGNAGQDARAEQYLGQAERIAPNHPAVKALREKTGKRGTHD